MIQKRKARKIHLKGNGRRSNKRRQDNREQNRITRVRHNAAPTPTAAVSMLARRGRGEERTGVICDTALHCAAPAALSSLINTEGQDRAEQDRTWMTPSERSRRFPPSLPPYLSLFTSLPVSRGGAGLWQQCSEERGLQGFVPLALQTHSIGQTGPLPLGHRNSWARFRCLLLPALGPLQRPRSWLLMSCIYLYFITSQDLFSSFCFPRSTLRLLG